MSLGPNAVREITDLGITLSDGTRLSARVWMPEDADAEPVPAILEYLPYRKRDGTCARDALTHPWFAARGYACLRVDMRGNGDSDGIMEDEYTPRELSDAVEVIDWIAAQPWCSGRVGMMGISWGGFNSLQVAALDPGPLKAIVTLCSTVDRFADDIHYKGGCLLNENLGWGGTMLSFSSRPPDPAIVGERWRRLWLERLAAEPHLTETWLDHQHRDAYWQQGSVCEDYSAIKAATLAVGGWGDAYKNAVPTLVDNLDAPVKGIIGPWIHKYPHFAVPEPRIGFLQEALRWWDRWLKGTETGVEADPDLVLYLMESMRPKPWYTECPGRWIAPTAADTPLRGFHLTESGLAEAPGSFTAVVDSPLDCGMMAGEYCAMWLGPELPGDQRRDDALSVCFDSDPLDGPLAVVGAPRITLTLAANQPVAQIAVRLCEVHPDGASTRITYGVLNLTHRHGAAVPEPLPVGQPLELTLTLDHIAYRVAAGNRLRLAISNAYWPLIWPAPTGTRLTLTAGRLDVPVAADSMPDSDRFLAPDAADPWRTETRRPPVKQRQVEFDQASGESRLVISDDFGEVRDLEHGLVSGSACREIWSIQPDDPNSARGEIRWVQTLGRDDWSVRTETWSEMRSDPGTFYLSAGIEAFEGEKQVFEKQFSRAIPRRLV